MPQLPIDPELRPPYRRRQLLRLGQAAGWWVYESENPAGFTTPAGTTFDDTSYTLRIDDKRVTLSQAKVDELLGLADADRLVAEVLAEASRTTHE